MIFTDETKINLHGSDGIRYVWKRINEPILTSKTIRRSKRFGGGGVMFWGCFGAKNIGYACKVIGPVNSDVYEQILKDQFLPSVLMIKKTFTLLQDNAACHKSTKIMKWLEKKKVKFLDFPAN